MTRAIGAVLLLIAPVPAFAQRDIAGNWAALYHEDQPHRIPGPELGDYTGIPLNDAGMLMSLVGELKFCQVVDPLKTVRFEFPKWVLKEYGFEMP